LADAERDCRRFERLAIKQTTATADVPLPPDADAGMASTGGNAGFAALRGEPRHVRRALLLSALYALGPWATIGFPLLSASVMVHRGFHINDSLLFAGASMFGPTLGIGAVAFVVDRVERRLALMACAAVMAVLGITFAISTSLVPLTALGTGFNLTSALYSAVLSLYGAELFPTALRASATALAWGVGRVIAALVPIALLPLLGAHGPLAMFAVITAALIASIVLILVAGPPGLARRPIE
jgi:putative MFS transporter